MCVRVCGILKTPQMCLFVFCASGAFAKLAMKWDESDIWQIMGAFGSDGVVVGKATECTKIIWQSACDMYSCNSQINARGDSTDPKLPRVAGGADPRNPGPGTMSRGFRPAGNQRRRAASVRRARHTGASLAVCKASRSSRTSSSSSKTSVAAMRLRRIAAGRLSSTESGIIMQNPTIAIIATSVTMKPCVQKTMNGLVSCDAIASHVQALVIGFRCI